MSQQEIMDHSIDKIIQALKDSRQDLAVFYEALENFNFKLELESEVLDETE